VSLHTFNTAITDPIEFGGDPAVATSRLTGPATVITADNARDIAGICETIDDAADRANHGRDWWPLSLSWSLQNQVPRIPGLVCKPRTTEEVSKLLAYCNTHGIAVTASGGRSGVCGAAIPLREGVALDMTNMQSVESVDEVSGIIEVLAGTFGPDMEDAARTHGLTVGHFPQSFALATVGGWVACRGAGQYSTRYGKIEDMVHALEAVLADGTIIRTGGAPAGAVGPDLSQLLLGSEGTLAVITRVWLRAHPLPEVERRGAYVFDTLSDGFEACRRIIRNGATPAVLRLYDGPESKRSHGGNGTNATLLVLDEGTEQLIDATMAIVHDVCMSMGATVGDVALVEAWTHHRNDTSGLQALTRKGYVVDTMEIAANWADLDNVVEAVETAMLAVPGARSSTCHLSHSYIEGACIYFTFAATPSAEEFESTYLALWDAGQRAALAAGANLSHHHGIGYSRSQYMEQALGTSMQVLRSVKNALDPKGILNPGKLGL
jgi:alkyldihydroxyacetonephosphate synthase